MARVVFTFIAVVLILYLSYLFSRYLSKGMSKSSSSKYMRLIDQITMGQDRHIAVVQIGTKYLLVGITAGQVNILTEIEDEELIPLSPDSPDSDTKTLDFRSVMGKLSDMTKKGR